MKTIEANESLNVANVKVLIYSNPGIGKTTLAFTAGNSCFLDFDRGTHRCEGRKRVQQPELWYDVAPPDVLPLSEHELLVGDTMGRALELLQRQVMDEDRKLFTASGVPTKSGWPEITSRFVSWMYDLAATGKDVLFTAHQREEQSGDDQIRRPDVPGGVYREVHKYFDAIGRMFVEDDRRFIDFSPRAFSIGKNPCNLPVFEVPNVADDPDFLGNVIHRIKEKLCGIQRKHEEVSTEVTAVRNMIKAIKKQDDRLSEFRLLKARVDLFEEPCLSQAKELLKRAMPDLGLTWDPEEQRVVLA